MKKHTVMNLNGSDAIFQRETLSAESNFPIGI